MFRVVRELRPAWVLGENVAGIVSMELESCCSDLESEGYTVMAFLIPACGVGAWHRRERCFIVANTNRPREAPSRTDHRMGRQQEPIQDTTNPHSTGLSRPWIAGEKRSQDESAGPTPTRSNWWDAEPAVGRVVNGVPHRVDRLRCLGNAVVPQQVYPILAGIAQIEKEKTMIAENGEVRE
jgi:DNA (cytosine-5)-methyltransferase 1